MARFATGSGPSQRQLRVSEQVRHAVSQVLQRGDVRDDKLENAVIAISEVRMSPDLKIATCFVSPVGAADSEGVISALNRNARFIRGRAASHLKQMKYMPEFRFRIDTSFDNYAKIDALLRKPEVTRDLVDEEDDGGDPNPGDVPGHGGDGNE
ncbi:30S ribosome-binding factor RbfA [Phyllobacterium endophyticum]|uniref:Ribosome-binding factor A n=1 Tax=Phyllobacterium endophyticum TaxID=1149773 RepID=A0A2P7B0C3_9HYPH|nr:30S ribosome-binding factor RbfA [Phyllobacterium endophyticum]MBB3235409.1 ribosome-binding factor A [Phyllobacterium endophyticum]PSH59926.1 30S ribosome-binding factor RbfA [Phyllobacterium endophyticum]TXR50027.1 30S ribosome-binding factor RbfA [Phyllobacterium endophyticum]TYR42088.1 30S ribosome-binding factor RbfA [Phyllobacterium endophyticum]